MIEVSDLFPQDKVFQKQGARMPCFQGVLIVGELQSLLGGEVRLTLHRGLVGLGRLLEGSILRRRRRWRFLGGREYYGVRSEMEDPARKGGPLGWSTCESAGGYYPVTATAPVAGFTLMNETNPYFSAPAAAASGISSSATAVRFLSAVPSSSSVAFRRATTSSRPKASARAQADP